MMYAVLLVLLVLNVVYGTRMVTNCGYSNRYHYIDNSIQFKSVIMNTYGRRKNGFFHMFDKVTLIMDILLIGFMLL